MKAGLRLKVCLGIFTTVSSYITKPILSISTFFVLFVIHIEIRVKCSKEAWSLYRHCCLCRKLSLLHCKGFLGMEVYQMQCLSPAVRENTVPNWGSPVYTAHFLFTDRDTTEWTTLVLIINPFSVLSHPHVTLVVFKNFSLIFTTIL